ncbi:YcxB family protein [Clostridium sp.]|uniref:YcxB family protein n=1 Tax=Clostridium sp. TaxID=1506 RepID=UPI00321690EB
MEFTLNFYNEKIDIITFRSNLTIGYSQITKVLETENLYSLMIEKQNIILSKSGFINGDIDEFKLFIKEKGLIE